MFSALLGMLLLNETFTPSFLVGLVLISADVISACLTGNIARCDFSGSSSFCLVTACQQQGKRKQ